MTGQADPMMHFPASTVFTPYSILRNLAAQPVAVTPVLYWMEDGAARSARLASFPLGPLQTQKLDVPSLLALGGLKNFNGSMNLIFEVQGPQQSVLLASGSVDKNDTYVFEVIPKVIKQSASKNLSYWSTANGDDTMVTLWNPADEPQDFLFKFLYSGGHYLLPIHLEARATRAFNVSEVIAAQSPDTEGNVIPLGMREGSAQISGAQAENQLILIAMDAGTYNVRKATCAYMCNNCNGAASWSLDTIPFATAVSGSTQLTFTATWNTGHQYNLNSASSWSSNNTSVATVSTGLVQGVAVGSVTINGVDSFEPLPGQVCGSPAPPCPPDEGVDDSGGGNVTPTVSFTGGNNFIFEGSDPTVTGFNLQQVQGNPTGGSFSWSGSSNSSNHPNIYFNGSTSPYSTSSDVVTVTGDEPSSSLLDTTLTVTYSVDNESTQTPATQAITIRLFKFLQQSGNIQVIPINNSNPPQYGYTSYVYYNVYTSPSGQLLETGYQNISVYETVSQPNSNFPVTEVTGTGGTNGNSQVVDTLSIYGSSPLPSNFSATADQYLGVGGFIVRHNTLTWSQSGPSITNLGPFS